MKLNEITLKDTHLMFEEQYDGRTLMRFSPGVAQVGNEWHVFLPDEKAYVVAENKRAATQIQKEVTNLAKNNKTPAQITSAIKQNVNNGTLKGAFNRQWNGISRAIKSLQFGDIANRPWTYKKLGTLAATNTFKTIGGLGRLVGPTNFAIIGMSYGCAVAIDDIEKEISSPTPPQNVDELRRLQDILVAQMITYMTAGLIKVFASGGIKVIKYMLRAIKTLVRGAQAVGVVSGLGTIPSLFSIIVTESAWIVIPMIVSMPAVQRALAEFISGTMFGDMVAWAGQQGRAAAETASELLDGRFGTDAMVRAMSGFDPKEATEGPTGEYYGDSEWAKNVFSGLLFPPGQASILVPYIPEQRREDLVAGVLNLNTMDTNNTAPAPSPGADPSTSSEPGLPTNPDAVPGPQ